ncbi:hypothetical protein MF271_22015 (plasmid) [Deinococcus sp. KNUC1210]|uniref:hypothetical protein n=1 Tax=Deinococcus sp. KNUC1210 TaxID=2917691 RepID=UPI001EF1224F|nr:hypothetical protein [Deinococcus sp. KNUC1210]ULH18156.1 hypothetical protein MF271_22015 [Deinococcus sp. KNUC1210]
MTPTVNQSKIAMRRPKRPQRKPLPSASKAKRPTQDNNPPDEATEQENRDTRAEQQALKVDLPKWQAPVLMVMLGSAIGVIVVLPMTGMMQALEQESLRRPAYVGNG